MSIDENETESLQQNEAIGPSLQTPNFLRFLNRFSRLMMMIISDGGGSDDINL
jgi:hypothetical protein